MKPTILMWASDAVAFLTGLTAESHEIKERSGRWIICMLRTGTHGSWRSFDSAHASPLRSG